MLTLTIETGNAAMSEPADVAHALRQLADLLEMADALNADDNGRIRDINGNTVGEWAIS